MAHDTHDAAAEEIQVTGLASAFPMSPAGEVPSTLPGRVEDSHGPKPAGSTHTSGQHKTASA